MAERLEPVREAFGPVLISSGFRCPDHNARKGGVLFSQHLAGLAADIACTGDGDRYTLVMALLDNGFKRIGIAARHVHADIGTITGPVIWTYY